MRSNYIIVALISLSLFSCRLFGERINGDGRITSQVRSTGSFHSVDVSGAIKVHIRQENSNSVKVETDANLLEHIDVFTDGNTLVIREKKGVNLNPSKDIVVYLAAPAFKFIEVSGACDIIGDGLIAGNEALEMHASGSSEITMEVNLPKLTTDISGAGTIALKGKATEFIAEVSGSGEVKCIDLVTEKTVLDLSGAADAEITANTELDIEASGASNINYRGNARVNQKISGAGSVKKVS